MALYICPDCGSKVSSRIDKCPKCGCPVSIMLNQSSDNDDSKKPVSPVEVPKIVMEDTPVSVLVEEPQKTEPDTSNIPTEPVVPPVEEMTSEKPNNKSLYILWAIVAVLLIAILFVKFRPKSDYYEPENYVSETIQPSTPEATIEDSPEISVQSNPEADKRLEDFLNKLNGEPLKQHTKLLKSISLGSVRCVFFAGNLATIEPEEGPYSTYGCLYVYDAVKDELRILTKSDKLIKCSLSELSKQKFTEAGDEYYRYISGFDDDMSWLGNSADDIEKCFSNFDQTVVLTLNGIQKINLSDFSLTRIGTKKSVASVVDDKYIVEYTSAMEMYQGFDFDTATFVVRDINTGNKIANPFFKQETALYCNNNFCMKLTIQENGYVCAEITEGSNYLIAIGCKKPSKDIYLYNVNLESFKIDDITKSFQLHYINSQKYKVDIYQSVGEAFAGVTNTFELTQKDMYK